MSGLTTVQPILRGCSMWGRHSYIRRVWSRNFLSEAYRCEGAWKERLKSPVLSRVKPQTLFSDIDNSFQHFARANAVDIDIFANIIDDKEMSWELDDILFKLRLSPDTHQMLPSTSHAVIRFLLQHGKKESLLTILRQKPAYGVFPDKFCSNIMMDTFLKEKDYRAAARVAVEEMLQENFDELLTVQLALYSCHMYLRNPEEWYFEDEIPEPEPQPKETIKIRVRYLRNPFFDDHFDIMSHKHLLGKTFTSFGPLIGEPIENYYSLLGFTLHDKYQRALEVSQSLKSVPREILTLAKAHLKEQSSTTDLDLLSQSLDKLESVATDEDIVVQLETMIKNTVSKEENKHIEELKKTYKDWEKKRIEVLKKIQEEEEQKNLLKSIEERKEELILEERELYFFENEEKLKLMVEEREALKKELDAMHGQFTPLRTVHEYLEEKSLKEIPHRKLKKDSTT